MRGARRAGCAERAKVSLGRLIGALLPAVRQRPAGEGLGGAAEDHPGDLHWNASDARILPNGA
ncbi:hypothetical protein GCM10022416_25490 [Actinomadura keratinilytica]|uniref:Uncharacterized protein n=1 Tax=Actinomadura keratinilytica TaxID=547461 RepID=A0ABP7YPH2_9ACTN